MQQKNESSIVEIKRIYFYCLIAGIPAAIVCLIFFRYNLFEELGATLVSASIFSASRLIIVTPSLSREEAQTKEEIRNDLIQFHAKIAITGTLLNGFAQQLFDFICSIIDFIINLIY